MCRLYVAVNDDKGNKNRRLNSSISTPYIVKDDLYKYLKEKIPELK